MKNKLYKYKDTIVRVLKESDQSVFIIDCLKTKMPYTVHKMDFKDAILCDEDLLMQETNEPVFDISEASERNKKIAYERYNMIAPLLSFMDNKYKRTSLINQIYEERNISKQTLRNYFCKYLIYQNICVLAPKVFLKSLIPESVADSLLAAYPNVVNDVADGKLDTIDFSKVKGVREKTWKKIKDKIIDNYLISDIITLLKPLGVTFTMIKNLLSNEPNPGLLKQKIENNPYYLCSMKGFGFKKVDKLALKLKPELLESRERCIAFISYYLTFVAYIPSIIRGKNILKKLDETNIPYSDPHIYDSEVEFKFKTADMNAVANLLKASSFGADITPYSLKNFPKANVTIPTDKMDEYKKIIAAIQKEDLLTFSRFTQSFLSDVLAKKLGRRNKPFDYKSDMKKLMMARQTKEYIYTKNMWDEYLKYLEEKIEKFYKEK